MSLPRDEQRWYNSDPNKWQPLPCKECGSTKRPKLVEALGKKHKYRSGRAWQAQCMDCKKVSKAARTLTGRGSRYWARRYWNEWNDPDCRSQLQEHKAVPQPKPRRAAAPLKDTPESL